MEKDSKLSFEQFCEIIRNNTTLNHDDNNSSDSENEVKFDINQKNGEKNFKSSKNVMEKVNNDKLIYNMTEGDDIVENPEKYEKTLKFKRINTTKA